jgi:hypothetical protein
MQDDSDGAQSDRFVVPFQGDMIECRSIEEAILLKNAGLVIRDGAAYNFTPAELDDMTRVLVQLQRTDAAEVIIGLRSKMHASRFLAETVGYKRPDPRPVEP